MALTGSWLERRVLAYAHQGGAFEAPSSTLYAIERAAELGATGIELDVHATADGVLVICHDQTVDRTTDGSGSIATLTAAELARLDNAYWFVPGAGAVTDRAPEDYPYRGRAPQDPAFGVASLATVLDLLDDHPGVALNLDIKTTAPVVASYEEALADLIRSRGYQERTIVASFLDVATERFRALAPDVATSAGSQAVAELWQAVHRGELPREPPYQVLQVPLLSGDLMVVDEQFVQIAHQLGLAVHVWTINDPKDMADLVDLGVDGIMTDRPSVLVDLLDRRGVSYHRS
ncbi:MAG: glycerophosphodiester phosphodiesterase [Actinomycetota bacterium]|nr:glycerophosphodiester phosphodiesterase [Actinomycetota bacterium]